MNEEVWKNMEPIGISRYSVSVMGTLRNDSTGRLLGVNPADSGYHRVSLQADNNSKINTCIHVLVAKMFIPNPDGKPSVDHINRDRSDNNPKNLRWSTLSEQSYNRKSHTRSGRPIYQLSTDGEIIKRWEKIKDAESVLSIGNSNITACAKGTYKTAGGYIWKYCDDVDEDLPGEEWKQLLSHEGYYISNMGRVKYPNGAKVYGSQDEHDYMIVSLTDKKSELVHRLVCLTFHGENPDTKDQVNHIDGVKNNNKSCY